MENEKKKRVLLLNPPGEKNYLRDGYCSAVGKGTYFCPPSDLLVLSGVLDPAQFEVVLLDALAEKLLPGDVLRFMEGKGFDAVISQVASASSARDLDLLRRIRAAHPGARIAVNGEYALHSAKEVLEGNPAVDAVIQDFTSSDVDAFLRGERREFGSLSWREDGRVSLCGGGRETEIRLPGVPRHDLLKAGLYQLPWARRWPMTATVTSFGCPFHCAFCVAGAYKYKMRPIDEVIAELRLIQRQGIREVYFLDLLFTADRARTIELCERICSEGIDLTWSCLSRVNTYDEKVLGAMRKAGCHTIQLGVESGSDAMLKKVRKGFAVADVEKAVALANRCGVNADAFFILGMPQETREDMDATVVLAKRLDFNLVSFQLAMPLKGTEFAKALPKDGVPFDDDERAVSINPSFSVAELKEIQRRAFLSYYFRPKFVLKKVLDLQGWDDLRIKARQALGLFSPVRRSLRPISGHPAFARALDRYRAKSRRVHAYMRLKRPFYDSWMWQVLDLLPPQGKIYDVGCGFGLLGVLLAEIHGPRVQVEGLDMDPERLRVARESAEGLAGVSFRDADVLSVEFRDAAAVVMTDFLHHVSPELQERMLRHVAGSLPEGGVLLIKEISRRHRWAFECARLFEKALYPLQPVEYPDERRLDGLLRAAGFRGVDIIDLGSHNIIRCER